MSIINRDCIPGSAVRMKSASLHFTRSHEKLPTWRDRFFIFIVLSSRSLLHKNELLSWTEWNNYRSIIRGRSLFLPCFRLLVFDSLSAYQTARRVGLSGWRTCLFISHELVKELYKWRIGFFILTGRSNEKFYPGPRAVSRGHGQISLNLWWSW